MRRARWAIVEDQQVTATLPSRSGSRVSSERLRLEGVTRAVRNKVGVEKVGSGSCQGGSSDYTRSRRYLKRPLRSPFFCLRGIWRILFTTGIFGRGKCDRGSRRLEEEALELGLGSGSLED